ncbi:hybrid sensor histidine kinase/response regulator [uncultured Sphingomonas sp.]|uniref:ATP-binding response regulator n=1 Tax=uncultured Sphingomonas sp. TaxID=158754 RepID=UPI0035CA7BE8
MTSADDPLVAELRRAKHAAEAANEAKTRYLVSVSHEIRSPLNAIYGYAQLLERGGDVPPQEAGAVIRRSAEHLSNLVESMLEISRIESGTISLRSDPVDIRAFLAQVVDMFRIQAAAKGLSLDLRTTDRLPALVRTDEKRLRQIFINLVSNAVKYTAVGGIVVTVGYRSQVADIEVRDTGPGIAADEVERVFEPFERGGSAETQAQPGIGLGLAITRLLARVMGGDITVRSTPGDGSQFRLRLMLPEVAGRPVEPARHIGGYEGPARTVLIVDDDPAQLEVLQSLLRPLGFVVYAAGNGADGVALAARCSPDIVLLDIQMPGMGGWAAAERLRVAFGASLRIVMVSANAHEATERAGHDGHDAFLSKPVALDALLAVMGDQLGLTWSAGQPRATPEKAPAFASLPLAASARLDRVRRAAGIGHVRGVEAEIRALRDEFPEARALASVLERHAGDYDLPALVEVLDREAR